MSEMKDVTPVIRVGAAVFCAVALLIGGRAMAQTDTPAPGGLPVFCGRTGARPCSAARTDWIASGTVEG